MAAWDRQRPDHDSGRCHRPPRGVSSRHAHRGTYSMKLTINTESGKAGCRQNRDVEARTGKTFVYSARYYLPRREVPTRDMWNVFQFKSDSPTVDSIGTDPFWTINIVQSRRGGPLRLVLKWKGGLTDHTQGVRGPFVNSPMQARMYRQRRTVVPIRRWFKSAHTSNNLEASLGVWPCARTASCSGTCGMFVRSIRMEGRAGASPITRTAFETTPPQSSSTTRE